MALWRLGRLCSLADFVGAFGAGNFALNQANDKIAFIFSSMTSAAITRIGFRLGATPNGSGVTWQASIQGVDGTNGNPDGSIKVGGTALVTFTNASPTVLTNGNFFWLNLAASYTPAARGEALALVLEPTAITGAPSAGTQDLTFTITGSWQNTYRNIYASQNDNAGGWVKQTGTPVFAYGTASLPYGLPIKTGYAQAFNSGSSPNEYGQRFLIPSGSGSTYTIRAARIFAAVPAAGTNSFIVRIYDGTPSVIYDVTVDSEIVNGVGGGYYAIPFDEASLPALSVGTPYYLTISPQTANNVTISGITVDSQADLDAYGFGQEWYAVSRAGGAFTTIPASRLMIELDVDDYTATSGGGLLLNSGMLGGMRG